MSGSEGLIEKIKSAKSPEGFFKHNFLNVEINSVFVSFKKREEFKQIDIKIIIIIKS